MIIKNDRLLIPHTLFNSDKRIKLDSTENNSFSFYYDPKSTYIYLCESSLDTKPPGIFIGEARLDHKHRFNYSTIFQNLINQGDDILFGITNRYLTICKINQ